MHSSAGDAVSFLIYFSYIVTECVFSGSNIEQEQD